MARQLKNIQDFTIARRAHKSLLETVAQKDEVITIKDVRAQKMIMNQNDVRKAEVALARAKNAALLEARKQSKALVTAWEPFRSIVIKDKKAHEKYHERMLRLFVNRMAEKKK